MTPKENKNNFTKCTLVKIVYVFAISIVMQHFAIASSQKNVQKLSASLSQKVAKKGHARIIVKLSQSFSLDASLLNKKSKLIQRSKISKAQDNLFKKHKFKKLDKVRRYKTMPYLAMEVNTSELAVLQNSPEVEYIYEDALLKATLSESNPLVGANNTQEMGFDGSGFAVAILDTGVDSSHPFFNGRVVHEACFSTTSTTYNSFSLCPNGNASQTGTGAGVNCNPLIPGCDHGTHVAGIASGQGATFDGMAPNASIIAVQVFSRFEGAYCGATSPCILSYIGDQIAALEYLYLQRDNFKIASVNMSLGGGVLQLKHSVMQIMQHIKHKSIIYGQWILPPLSPLVTIVI